MSGLGRLFLIVLGGVALFIGLAEPTNKTSVDLKLKEITDQRPDAFMQGIQMIRVHDVNEINQSIKVFKELIN